MPQIEISPDLLARLNTIAEKDYERATIEQTLDRLLHEHQEHVMLGAAAQLARNEAERH
jgi:hypothetical protein